jgi:hypothetical protein
MDSDPKDATKYKIYVEFVFVRSADYKSWLDEADVMRK